MKTAIIVEDEKMLRNILTRMLEHFNYDVKAYSKYEELMAENVSDVCQCDIGFYDHDIKGGMTGYDFFICYKEKFPKEKRILMSGANKWHTSGIEGLVLDKPFDMKMIEELIYMPDFETLE